METLKAAISLISKDCYMASIDLQDAYYSCKVNVNDRKYFFDFSGTGKHSNGLSVCTKNCHEINETPFSTLRKQGFSNIANIDNTLLVSDSETVCAKNVKTTAKLLGNLGLTVNIEKSIFTPAKEIQFLGSIINSNAMTVSSTDHRAKSIRQMCQQILASQSIVIRQLAHVIGKLVASELGVQFAPLYYKSLEIEKDRLLKQNFGDYEARVSLSPDALITIQW